MNQEIIDRVREETRRTLGKILMYATEEGIETYITAASPLREYINELVGYDFIALRTDDPDEFDFVEVMSDCNTDTDYIEDMSWLAFESLHHLNECKDKEFSMEVIIEKIVNDVLEDSDADKLLEMINTVGAEDLVADFLSINRFNEVSLLPEYFVDYLNQTKPNGLKHVSLDMFTEVDFVYIIQKNNKIDHISVSETQEFPLQDGDIVIDTKDNDKLFVFRENTESGFLEVTEVGELGLISHNKKFGASIKFGGEVYTACEGMTQQLKWNLFDNNKYKVTDVLLEDETEPTIEPKVDEPKIKPRNKMKI